MTDTPWPPSVAVYPEYCAAVMSFLSTDTWLDQDDFDRASRTWQRDPAHRAPLRAYTPETIVLASLRGDPLLAVLQELVTAGRVKHRIVNRRSKYRAA